MIISEKKCTHKKFDDLYGKEMMICMKIIGIRFSNQNINKKKPPAALIMDTPNFKGVLMGGRCSAGCVRLALPLFSLLKDLVGSFD